MSQVEQNSGSLGEPELLPPPGAPAIPAHLRGELEAALRAKGPAYTPRTHHLRPDGQPRYVNRLILETSPYLLQHAHNPVGWYAWGPEAFEAARALHRPILLSVGYSTCHWCHVMEVESFEDLEIARFINEHFIPVKVDREERPDVDDVYMNAVQLMNNGGGGWPMTVVLTTDGRPFFGGTYFPPRDGERGARMGFLTILGRISAAWTESPERVAKGAEEVHSILEMSTKRLEPQGIPSPTLLAEAARALASRFDPRYGGFGVAPKFPRPSVYDLLLRYYRRTADEGALAIVTWSLTHMANGGIYDQLGGGFHRYSTDDRWLVPHFEKMLYDNAQLVSTLLETAQASRDPGFAEIARETLEYVLREMTSPEGAFYSATDADSEGEEGRFFVWTPDQLTEVLGERRARIAAAWFDVTKRGNFEGKNILHRARAAGEVARQLELGEDELEQEIEASKQLLYSARKKRIPPLLDDKVLTEWNAQMISAFARASIVLDEPRYAATATRAAEVVLDRLTQGGRPLRAYRAGQAKHMGVLEDYAFLTAALLDLFEATQEGRWLERAIEIQAQMDAHFLDSKQGGYFGTADDAEALLFRDKPVYDGAQPSGNSVAAQNLLRLAAFTGRADYRRAAERTLMAFGAVLERAGLESPKLLAALDWFQDVPKEVVIVTSPADDGRALRGVFARTLLPNRVYVVVEEGPALERLAKLVPWLENKRALGGRATAYVCTEGACEAPTSSTEVFERQLQKVNQPLPLQKKLKLPS